MLEVAQTIALLSTISEREKDQNVVTLSTLHAAKGLEWPHVVLVGCVEGMLPFKPTTSDGATGERSIVQRLQEERRLMYVGITRAQRSLAVSWTSGARRAARWSRRSRAGSSPRWRWTRRQEGGSARKAQGAARGVREEECRGGCGSSRGGGPGTP